MAVIVRVLVVLFIFYSSTVAFSGGLSDVFKQFDEIEKNVNQIKHSLKGEPENGQQNAVQSQANEVREFSGEVVVPDSNRTWYFKMDKFSAAACSRIYYSVNDGNPHFLVEYAGQPDVGAAMPIKGLKKGDRIVFLVKTSYYGWHGPVYSTDRRFFIAEKYNDRKYYFKFEDAARADARYNDGAFYFFEEGQMPVNHFIRILSYDVYKQGNKYLFRGKIKLNVAGNVDSQILIKDNHWHTTDVIKLNFYNNGRDIHSFSFSIPKTDFPKPAYTSILKVSYNGEKDLRVRMVKPCVDKLPEQINPFGTIKKDPFVFVGRIYYLRKNTTKLPNFSKLRPRGIIYTPTLNVTPRSFDSGFPGITSRYEWFAIRYTSELFLKEPKLLRFALLSDDGSKLIIDNKVVINNDGIHPPRKKYGSVYLESGLHKIEVQYFQGPRYQVALVLYVIENGKERVLDISRFAPVVSVNNGFGIRRGVLFEEYSDRLKPEGIKVLMKIKKLIGEKYKSINIYGRDDELSKDRIKSIVNMLVGFGIDPSRIRKYYGLGDSSFSIKIVVN